MRAYPNVPSTWYLVTLCLSLGAATVLVLTTPLQFPVWGLLLAVGMSLFFLVPIGILKAVSDTSIGLNVITECADTNMICRWLPHPWAPDWK